MYATKVAPKLAAGVADAYYCSENSAFVLYRGDCRQILARMPDETVDLIFADPPYLTNGKR